LITDRGVGVSKPAKLMLGRFTCWQKKVTFGSRSMLRMNPLGLKKLRSLEGQESVAIRFPLLVFSNEKAQGVALGIKLACASIGV
jgi:hypothetical protein